MRFVYCYSMKEDPDAAREAAPKHAAYWHELRLPEYVGGPFADRSGGLISFEAPVDGSARQLVSSRSPAAHITFPRMRSPFNDWWLKVWLPQ